MEADSVGIHHKKLIQRTAGSSAPDLPTGYKERMDKEVLTIMPAARRVMEICREFCSDSVEITDGDVTVRLTQNKKERKQ